MVAQHLPNRIVNIETRVVRETKSRVVVNSRHVFAALRIAFGVTFFWVFLDKLFGLTFETEAGQGWLQGGSPTHEFLSEESYGPLHGFYQSIAGTWPVDGLYMAGLAGVGIAMLLGVGVRVASAAGALMLLLIYSARLLPDENPILDEHIVLMLAIIAVGMVGAGRTWGLGKWWQKQAIVKKYPMLR